MAATAKASSEMAAVAAAVAILALALTGASDAPTRKGHSQCSKYPSRELKKMEWLLRDMEPAPMGNATVLCGEEEKDCLINSWIFFPGDPDIPCVPLGSPCTLQDGSDGMVRASLYYWKVAGRLVGECAPPPRCNATHVMVRRRWFSPAEQCMQAGQLLCACARLEPRQPVRPFPGVDCHCDGEAKLQPAPFGGYECVHTCMNTCSPQINLPEGRCAFPPLAVDGSAHVYTTDQYHQPKESVKDINGLQMRPPPKPTGRKHSPWLVRKK